jgi:hypothetical protein
LRETLSRREEPPVPREPQREPQRDPEVPRENPNPEA